MTQNTLITNINIFSSFDEVKHVWKIFEENGDYLGFQTFHWLHHWYKTIGQYKKHKLFFIYVSSDFDMPLCFFPLIIEWKSFVRCLKWQGDGISDYQAPLLHRDFSQIVKEDDFKRLWQNILKGLPKFDVIHFRNIPKMIGSQKNPFLFLKLTSHHKNSYCAILSKVDSWEDYYLHHVKKSIQSDSRRQRKRLSEIGRLEFFIAEDSNDIRIIIEKMINQKRRRYRETGAHDIFSNKNVRDFYLQAALSLVPMGLIHVTALKLNGEILATHWGMVTRNTFYYLMPTYDGGEWKKFSCGRILLEFLLGWSFEKKLDFFDFTGGGEEYKKIWCNLEMKLYEQIVPNNCIGQLYLVMQHFKKFIRNYPEFLQIIRKFLQRLHVNFQ